MGGSNTTRKKRAVTGPTGGVLIERARMTAPTSELVPSSLTSDAPGRGVEEAAGPGREGHRDAANGDGLRVVESTHDCESADNFGSCTVSR
jgi:hypothetical protein